MRGAVASAAVFVKISERRASMTGMTAPQSHAVQLIHAKPPDKRTTIEIARDMLDNVLGISIRERFLLDKAD